MKREGRPRLLVLRATVLAAVLIAVVDPTSAWAASAAAHGSPHQIGADPHQIGAKYLTSLTGPGAPGERSDVGRPSSKDVHTARLLVRFHRSASPTERAAALRLVGGRIDAELAPLGVVRIAIDRATDALSAGPSPPHLLPPRPARARGPRAPRGRRVRGPRPHRASGLRARRRVLRRAPRPRRGAMGHRE